MKTTKHIRFIFMVISILPLSILGQHRWDSLPGLRMVRNNDFRQLDVLYSDSSYIYMAGAFNTIGTKHLQGIARWNGTQWDSMGSGIEGLNYDTLSYYPQNTWSIVPYHNKLYVGGVFSSLGRIKAPCIGTWDGNLWDSLAIQPFKSNSNNGVIFLATINSKLYIGGLFDTIAGLPCIGIAQWNDTNWSTLNFPNLGFFYSISSISEYHGSIYVGGNFGDESDSTRNILRYDSTGWHNVGTGMHGSSSWISNSVVYNGELYVAGYFFKTYGNIGDNIQRWDGTNWHEVGGGINWEVFHLMVFNGKLYAMGSFSSAGGVPSSKIAEWDGSKWCSLGSVFNNTILASCIYKDSMYIGGGFQTIDNDSITYLAKWLTPNYTDSCGNDATGTPEVKVESEGVSLFPNPCAETAQLIINNEHSVGAQNFAPCKIEVFNVFGQMVYSRQSLTTNHYSLDLSSQPNGVYFYRVGKESLSGESQGGERVGAGKIVIQK